MTWPFASDVASRVVLLHQGLIEDQGVPREMFANPRSDRLRQFLAGARGL